MKLTIQKGDKALMDDVRILTRYELHQFLDEEFDRKNNIYSMEIP